MPKNATPRPLAQGLPILIPEADTAVERPNLVQKGKIPPSSCCKIAFACILLHLQAGKKAKTMPRLLEYVRESCEENINDPGPRAALSK